MDEAERYRQKMMGANGGTPSFFQEGLHSQINTLLFILGQGYERMMISMRQEMMKCIKYEICRPIIIACCEISGWNSRRYN